MKLPDRWLEYKKSARIVNTPFVACKTPLRKGFSDKLDPNTSIAAGLFYHALLIITLIVSFEGIFWGLWWMLRIPEFKLRFTPIMLLEAHPRIKLVIDLTMTLKYYNGLHSPISKQHSKFYVTGLATDRKQEFEGRGVKYVKISVNGQGQIPSEADFKMFAETVRVFLETHPKDSLIAVHCTHGINRTGYFIVRYMIENMGCDPEEALQRFRICRGHPIERVALVRDLRRKCRNVREVSNVRTTMFTVYCGRSTEYDIIDSVFVKSNRFLFNLDL